MPQPTTDSAPLIDLRSLRKSLLLLVVAMGLMFWSSSAGDRFLPSPDVLWLKLLLSGCTALAAICTFLGMQRHLDLQPARLLGSLDTAPLSVLYAVFAFVFLNVFLPGLLPLLHHFSQQRPTVRIESVWVDPGSRRDCSTRASLMDDSLWMRRRLCRIDPSTYTELEKTGRMEIVGTASYFGVAVREYRAVPAGATGADQKP